MIVVVVVAVTLDSKMIVQLQKTVEKNISIVSTQFNFIK